jgi:hypothetical protein
MPLTLDGTNGEVFPSWTTATRPATPSAGQTGFNTTTGQLETYNGSGWRISTAASTQGTSGQYLQSAGAGAAPTWATLSATGALIRAPQILTSGTSYTTPAGCNNILIEMIGGGAGGGGVNRTGNGESYGGGGGAGIYATKYVSVTPSTSYTYAVGSGGAGATATGNSGSGGNTTFTVGATTYTSGGGTGVNYPGNNSSSTAGAAGTATNMDNSIAPIAGGQPFGGQTLTPYGFSIGGYRNWFAPPNAGAYQGIAGYGFGAGGGGGYITNTTGTAAGGAGYQGMIRISEFT